MRTQTKADNIGAGAEEKSIFFIFMYNIKYISIIQIDPVNPKEMEYQFIPFKYVSRFRFAKLVIRHFDLNSSNLQLFTYIANL